jgi:hypothetical protein
MKLKTKIVHSFDIEEDLMEDLEFTVTIPTKDIKKKTKIVVEKKKSKIRNDASTRLF